MHPEHPPRSSWSGSVAYPTWTTSSMTPHRFVPPGSEGAPLLTLQLARGELKIYADGRIERPDDVEPSAQQFWEYVQQMANVAFCRAVRAEAAALVRDIVPTLVELTDYQQATLPHAVATAVAKR